VARFSISNNGSGYLNIQSSNAAETLTRNIVLNADGGSVGIGTANPAYVLDVCGSAGSASMNLATWPRVSVSNVFISRGITGTTSVGNTVVFQNNVQNTIDPNLMTVDLSNTTSGSSFKFLKSGVWSITAIVFNGTQGIIHWLDVSTNNNNNVGFTTNGNPVIALAQSTAYSIQLNFTGWLPGSTANFYKLRFNSGSISASTFAYFQAALLYETPNSAGSFPY